MKRFYLLTILCALLGINQAWGEEVIFDGTADWGSTKQKYDPESFKIEKSHVTFFLTKDMKQYNSSSSKHDYFFLENGSTSNLKWSVDKGYTIAVSAVSFVAHNNRATLWSEYGKSYVHTTRMSQDDRKRFSNQGDWERKTFAVSDAEDNLFGETPTALTNDEYFILTETTNEGQLQTCTLTYTITANDYTITLDNQSATEAGSESIIVTFDANTNLTGTPAITKPTKTGEVFEGYFTEENGAGTKIIDRFGNVLANASDATYTYTDADKNWKYVGNITLYAKWVDQLDPSVTCKQTSLDVDEQVNEAFTFEHTDGITWAISNVKIDAINNGDGQVIAYDVANNKLIAHNAGTATITFTQAATAEIKYGEFAFDITVSKLTTNELKCAWDGGEAADVWTKEAGLGSKTCVVFSNTIDEAPAIKVDQKEGDDIALYKEGALNEPDSLISNHRSGTAVWTITQPENYKYVKIEKECTLQVKTLPCDCYLAVDTWTDDKGEGHGFGAWGSSDQSWSISWTEEGAADSVAFTAKRSGGDVDSKLELYATFSNGTSDSKFETIASSWTDSYKNFGAKIPDANTTGIRFERANGVNIRYVKNVYVYRKKWFDIEDAEEGAISSLEMPQNYPGENETRATFYLDYSTCADEIKLESTNSSITFADTEGETAYSFLTNGVHGRKAIELVYTSPADGEEELDETIIIYTLYERKELNVKATTKNGTTTVISATESDVKAKKILRDGHIYILRDGKVYNLNGQEVR